MPYPHEILHYWNLPSAELLAHLSSQADGLAAPEAQRRLQSFGPNTLRITQQTTALNLFIAQFKNPLLLILVVAASVSAFVREWIDAGIVLMVIAGSALLGFGQEYAATRAMEKLRARVSPKASVLRDGRPRRVSFSRPVPPVGTTECAAQIPSPYPARLPVSG